MSVSDTGMGIQPEALPRLFEAFEQGERSVSRRFGGLGLGLAISKAMAELHGGRIVVDSGGTGRGATFTVELPTVTPAPEVRVVLREEPDSRPADQGLRILLVEDHGDTSNVMTRLLRRLRHQVVAVPSLGAAREAADTQPFDLVVSDLGLPDGSGLELMRELRERHGLRGIALTGYGREEDVQASREAGFVRHLTKPVDFAKLVEAITELGS